MVNKSILAKVGDKINYKLIRDGYKTGKGNVVVTAEMDTKTTIVADVPSTAYTSNLDYEVDISGENPPVINIKNDITCPDDTVISKGKYLFYDIGQKYNVPLQENAIISKNNFINYYGCNENIEEQCVSGFANNFHLRFKLIGGILVNDEPTAIESPSNFIIQVKVKTPSSNQWTSNGCIMTPIDSTNSTTAPSIYINKTSAYLMFNDGSNRYQFNAFTGTLLNETVYWFKWVLLDGKITGYYSLDGVDWQSVETKDSTYNNFSSFVFDMGIRYDNDSSTIWNGNIYPNECEISVQLNERNSVGDIALVKALYWKGKMRNVYPNFVQGAINIDENNYASNFKNNSWILGMISYKMDASTEINVKFTTGSDITTNNTVFTLDNKLTDLWIYNGYACSYDGSEHQLFSVEPNTTYWVKCTQTDNKRIFNYSTNGINFNEISFDSLESQYYGYRRINIGLTNEHDKPFLGNIDLDNTNIKRNGNVIWQPFMTKKPTLNLLNGFYTIDEDLKLSNFSTDRYTKYYYELKNYSKIEIIMPLKTSSANEYTFMYSSASSSTSYSGLGNAGNKWKLYTYGTNYQGDSYKLNTWYLTRLVQEGGKTYLYVKDMETEGAEETLAVTSNSNFFAPSDYLILGRQLQYEAFTNGIIDWNNTIIKLDDVRVDKKWFYSGESLKGIKSVSLQDDGNELTTKLFDYHYREEVSSQDKASLYINSEKDNNLYYEKDGLQLNVSKVGSAIIDKKGIASNFGSNDYVTPGPINFGNGTWEMVFKVHFKSGTEYQRICGTKDNTSVAQIVIGVIPDNKLITWISSNGAGWDIAAGIESNDTLVNDTNYYIKTIFTGTNYIISTSTDNVNYNEKINVSSSVAISNPNSNFWIGNAESNSYPWQGDIDLKESYIQIGTNEKKYFAENIKKRHDIPSLYSEFIDNITIPAHALYDYVNGEWKLSGNSPVITQDVTVNADNAEITMKEIEE